MKHLTKILLVLLVFSSFGLKAQDLKFGHINSQELIAVMPERDSALVKLDAHAKELDDELVALRSEFQDKYNTYQQKQATWSATVLETRTKELQNIDASIQQFQQTAQQEYQQLQEMLFAPVFEKANEVIQQIGKERGLIYIFDISSGGIPYIDAQKSVDILPYAKETMNIPADKKPVQIGGQPVQE